MAEELTPADVELFTSGRLVASDQEVVRMLSAALAIARREAGWHVSPVVEDDVVVLDGPGSRILTLPTRKLVELTSVVEDGVAWDPADLRWSAGGPPGITERPVAVRKRSGAFWSGEYQAIEVTMTHGFTAAEAADWRQAVLSLVDQVASITGRDEASLVSKKVDDVTYNWGNPYSAAAEGVLYSVKSILCHYELPRLEFL